MLHKSHKLLSISAYLIGKLENNHYILAHKALQQIRYFKILVYILAHKALHQVGLAIIGPLHAT